jgi:hypothetical protein
MKAPRINLDVTGLTARSSNGSDSKDEHLYWINRDLAVGDRVEIRVFESETADSPTSAKPAATHAAQLRAQFKWAKSHYFANRSKRAWPAR